MALHQCDLRLLEELKRRKVLQKADILLGSIQQQKRVWGRISLQKPVSLASHALFVYIYSLESLEQPAIRTYEHFCRKTQETCANTFVKRGKKRL